MSQAPRVSIVVIVKNGMPYIRTAIESLTMQNCRDFEVVVQDAASTDGTTEYLQSVKGLDLVWTRGPTTGNRRLTIAVLRGVEAILSVQLTLIIGLSRMQFQRR